MKRKLEETRKRDEESKEGHGFKLLFSIDDDPDFEPVSSEEDDDDDDDILSEEQDLSLQKNLRSKKQKLKHKHKQKDKHSPVVDTIESKSKHSETSNPQSSTRQLPPVPLFNESSSSNTAVVKINQLQERLNNYLRLIMNDKRNQQFLNTQICGTFWNLIVSTQEIIKPDISLMEPALLCTAMFYLRLLIELSCPDDIKKSIECMEVVQQDYKVSKVAVKPQNFEASDKAKYLYLHALCKALIFSENPEFNDKLIHAYPTCKFNILNAMLLLKSTISNFRIVLFAQAPNQIQTVEDNYSTQMQQDLKNFLNNLDQWEAHHLPFLYIAIYNMIPEQEIKFPMMRASAQAPQTHRTQSMQSALATSQGISGINLSNGIASQVGMFGNRGTSSSSSSSSSSAAVTQVPFLSFSNNVNGGQP